jgi:hypothetical protein
MDDEVGIPDERPGDGDRVARAVGEHTAHD